jgi:biopolymer transport protein ExbB
MMIALIPCLILLIAFAIQGFLNLRSSRLAPRDFPRRLAEARREGGYRRARAVLEAEEHSLASIIRNVDDHLRFKPDADPAEVLRLQIEDECDALLQENSQLGIIYRITPLLGLLGTVFGMIQTFNEFAASARPDVRELSVGINVALITTAWGLSIAIPAFIGLYLIQRRIATHEQLVLPQLAADALHALLDRPISGSSDFVPPPRAED